MVLLPRIQVLAAAAWPFLVAGEYASIGDGVLPLIATVLAGGLAVMSEVGHSLRQGRRASTGVIAEALPAAYVPLALVTVHDLFGLVASLVACVVASATLWVWIDRSCGDTVIRP